VEKCEGEIGESQYYLNGKKVSKNTILEVIVAVPNKLNIVSKDGDENL